MPQANPSGGANDERLENVTFPQARIDINDNLEALQTLNSGNSEPSTKAAFMQWLDTSSDPAVLKIRNSANNGWIEVGSLSATEYATKGLTAIANGGTGATTAAAAIAALLPAQANNSGKNLTTDGSALSWASTISSSFTRLDYTGSAQTWTKPSTGTIVVILCWGGGGGGSRHDDRWEGGGGGGGGACGLLIKPFSELTDSTYTVTIGAGGAQRTSDGDGNDGGNSTVVGSSDGTIVTGYGGQGGKKGTYDYGGNAYGGNGGGNTRSGEDHDTINSWSNGRLGAISDGAGHGAKGVFSTYQTSDVLTENATFAGSSIFGGGGGAGGGTNINSNGANTAYPQWNIGGGSVFGGGGGGGSNSANGWDGTNPNPNGGTSMLGGNGGRGGGENGGSPAAGSTPGGGGGAGYSTGEAGGNGRVEFYVF